MPKSRNLIQKEMKGNIQVAVGTYERVLFGVKGEFDLEHGQVEDLDCVKLEPFFSSDDNTAYIQSLAASSSGRVLVSGSADDMIRVFNMSILKEVGSLTHHTGSITAFQFNENGSKLLSASADSTISVWRSSDWNNLGTLKYKPIKKEEEKKAMKISAPGIRSLSLHQTGKVALSVCKSGEICVWDMVKGSLVTFSKPLGLKVTASHVKWISSTRYAVVSGDKIGVYDFTENGVADQILEHSSPVLCMSVHFTPGNGEYFVCGCANGEMIIWNNRDAGAELNQEESEFIRVHSLKAHESRIKAIDVIDSPGNGFLVASGTSSGSLVVWSFECDSLSIRPVASYDSSMRITSLVIIPPIMPKKSRKRKSSLSNESSTDI